MDIVAIKRKGKKTYIIQDSFIWSQRSHKIKLIKNDGRHYSTYSVYLGVKALTGKSIGHLWECREGSRPSSRWQYGAYQWFSTFLTWPFHTASHTTKLFWLLLPNCKVATFMNHSGNIWYVDYQIHDPCGRAIQFPQRGWDPPFENCHCASTWVAHWTQAHFLPIVCA